MDRSHGDLDYVQEDGSAEPAAAGQCSAGAAGPCDAGQVPQLSAAQRARMERQRLRARALQDARLVRRVAPAGAGAAAAAESGGGGRALDSGGGFLLEPAAAEEAPRRAAPDAPVLDPAAQPRCLDCGTLFPQSYLFDTFDYHVCDACKDAEGAEEAYSLLTRTEAKSEFLLQDCDLDARPPPLRCVRRRNPHRGGADMRLYLRAQLQARALLVWGSAAALEEERARRLERRAAAARTHSRRRLRALRMDVRSSLFERAARAHQHRFGPERHDAAADLYERACLDCDHRETYEKM